ncbi:Serine/threonine-protein kinase TBK1 [Liparis tanakae]|uniref:Serine/threonine-protein kinase TBK1 n=1 Tax=Liparis tanakae TaxID=230148 RepID=A0A4Z2F3H7_9TELE|nr:Serine/threonine-protein kinase TBK1 [Liparis tanakae]
MKYRLFISKSEEWLRKVHHVKKQLLGLSGQLVTIEKEVTMLMERAIKMQEQLPQKVLPLVSGGMKPQAYLSQNTLVEMTLGCVFITFIFIIFIPHNQWQLIHVSSGNETPSWRDDRHVCPLPNTLGRSPMRGRGFSQ